MGARSTHQCCPMASEAAVPMHSQDSSYVSYLKQEFDVQPEQFIQILNSSGAHWGQLHGLAVQRLHFRSDSMYETLHLQWSTQLVSCPSRIPSHRSTWMPCISAMVVTVAFMLSCTCHIVQQSRSNASHFCPKILQPHFFKCLEEMIFSVIRKQRRKPQSSTEVLNIFCTFQTPDIKTKMAACDSCVEWFHRNCKHIPVGVFKGIIKTRQVN